MRAAARACLCGTESGARVGAGKIFNFSWVTSAQVGRIGKKRDIIRITNLKCAGLGARSAGRWREPNEGAGWRAGALVRASACARRCQQAT